MNNQQFQFALVAALSLGLGYSIASKDAIGYPAGSAVSYGANPVVSTGGSITPGGTATLFEAPADHDIVVTDMAFDVEFTDQTCISMTRLSFTLAGSSTVLARRSVVTAFWGSDHWQTYNVNTAMDSGVRVPAGETLQVAAESRYVDGCSDSSRGLAYTVSGYLAQG